MERDANEIIRSLIGRLRDKNFGLEFFIDVISLGLVLLTWIAEKEPTFGDRADSLGLLIELNEELGGEVALAGPITSVLISLVIKALVEKALEVLVESGLPQEVIDWIRMILEALQAKI